MIYDESRCTLYVSKGQFGLPSIDYNCLQALFTVNLKKNHNIMIKSSGFYTSPCFPMLEYDGTFYKTQVEILQKLKNIIGHLDPPALLGRIQAYKARTYEIVEPCIISDFWENDKNCQYLLKLYGSEKYFPLRLIYLRRMNTHVKSLINRNITTENHITGVHDRFEEYLVDLSHLLAVDKYLLGETPTTLDAFVCGYLVPIYALNFPDKALQCILLRYDLVVKYILSYLRYYDIKIEHDAIIGNVQESEDNEGASFGLIATAGLVAIVCMISYGVINDIIKV